MYALKLGQSLVSSNRIGVANDFVFEINNISLVGTSPNGQYQLALSNFGTTNVVVDWGDGAKDTITSYNAAETLHTYPTNGNFIVKMRGDYSFRESGSIDSPKMVNIEKWGGFVFKQSSALFQTVTTCTATDVAQVTSTNMSSTLKGNGNFNGVLNELDVSNVTNFQSFFFGNSVFNQPLNSWNTSSATRMDSMFRNAVAFDQDISSWDITSVTNLSNFMTGATLSTVNYDALLVGWEAQAPSTGVTVDFGSSKYSIGGTSAVSRNELIVTYGWTITDGGGI